jgi:hypothetical protein
MRNAAFQKELVLLLYGDHNQGFHSVPYGVMMTLPTRDSNSSQAMLSKE